MTGAKQRRSHFRFPAEEGTPAELTYTENGERKTCWTLVIDESFSGCALIFTGKPALQNGQTVEVKAGKLPRMVARVCWVKELEPLVRKVGLQFDDLAAGEK